MCKVEYFFILLVSLVFSGNLYSQEPIVPKKDVYVGEDGKMYINKNLPIYLSISTSPDENSEQFRLTSAVTTKYSNPMYLDTEGINTFRSPSAVDPVTRQTVWPIRDIVFEVYADGWTPETKLSFGNVLGVYKNGKYYCREKSEIILKSYDYVSGVSKIYYSIDKAHFVEYNKPFKLEPGEHTVQYYAVDKVGNSEKVNVINFVVEKSK